MKSETQGNGQVAAPQKAQKRTPVKRKANVQRAKKATQKSAAKSAKTDVVFSRVEIVTVAAVATIGSIAAIFLLPKLFSFGSKRASGTEDVAAKQSPFDLDVLPAP